MHTKIALSTIESKYIALFTVMREVIQSMGIMAEIADLFGLLTRKLFFEYSVWEDDNNCITVATSLKFTPRTKHIVIKHHHFKSFVSNDSITIKPFDTSEQFEDCLLTPIRQRASVT